MRGMRRQLPQDEGGRRGEGASPADHLRGRGWGWGWGRGCAARVIFRASKQPRQPPLLSSPLEGVADEVHMQSICSTHMRHLLKRVDAAWHGL
eukprot:scaffold17801_cov63-Phaeocystis_antarctica.AAC.2